MKNYKINTKYNGNFTTYYVNFEDETYAKLVVSEKQGIKRTFYNQVSISGNFDKSEVNISMGTLGEVVITPISKEKANINETLTHKIFGKVQILNSTNGNLEVLILKHNETKFVMEKFFMNGII